MFCCVDIVSVMLLFNIPSALINNSVHLNLSIYSHNQIKMLPLFLSVLVSGQNMVKILHHSVLFYIMMLINMLWYCNFPWRANTKWTIPNKNVSLFLSYPAFKYLTDQSVLSHWCKIIIFPQTVTRPLFPSRAEAARPLYEAGSY